MKKEVVRAAVVGGLVATATTVGVAALSDKKTRQKMAKSASSLLKKTKTTAEQLTQKANKMSPLSNGHAKKTVKSRSQRSHKSSAGHSVAAR